MDFHNLSHLVYFMNSLALLFMCYRYVVNIPVGSKYKAVAMIVCAVLTVFFFTVVLVLFYCIPVHMCNAVLVLFSLLPQYSTDTSQKSSDIGRRKWIYNWAMSIAIAVLVGVCSFFAVYPIFPIFG